MELTGVSGRRWRVDRDEELGADSGQGYLYRTVDRAHVVKLARRGQEAAIERERVALAGLHAAHPTLSSWVVPLIDHGLSTKGRPFLVLPWFPADLGVWVKERGLGERLAAAEGACEAVMRLHWTNHEMDYVFDDDRRVLGRVVHRDVKPSNFLIREEAGAPRVWLADFGAARQGGLRAVGYRTRVFTPEFAPPEQLLQRRVAPEPGWDVFALAATVYWCVAGALPFTQLRARVI